MPNKDNFKSKIMLGNNLKKYRIQKGLTQKQIADELHICRSTYTKYETNVAEPSLATILKIAEVLDCDIGCLLNNNGINFHFNPEISK